MHLKKLLKYRLNLNWLEDRSVIFGCHADRGAVSTLHEGSCHSSDVKMVWASQ